MLKFFLFQFRWNVDFLFYHPCFDWIVTFHLHAAGGVYVAWALRNPKPLHTVVYSYKQKTAFISMNHALNFIFLDKYDSKFVVHWLFIAEEELLVSRLVHVFSMVLKILFLENVWYFFRNLIAILFSVYFHQLWELNSQEHNRIRKICITKSEVSSIQVDFFCLLILPTMSLRNKSDV